MTKKRDPKKKGLNQLMTQFMQYQWETFKAETSPFEVLATRHPVHAMSLNPVVKPLEKTETGFEVLFE